MSDSEADNRQHDPETFDLAACLNRLKGALDNHRKTVQESADELRRLDRIIAEKSEAALRCYWERNIGKQGTAEQEPYPQVNDIPEYQEMQRIHGQRQQAGAWVEEAWMKMQIALDKLRSPNTTSLFTALDHLSRYAVVDPVTVDRRIALVETIMMEADGEAKRSKRRLKGSNEHAQTIASTIKVLIREYHVELTSLRYPKGQLHEMICKRLHNHTRPPRAAWAHLPWDRAYADPKYRNSVRAWISKALGEGR